MVRTLVWGALGAAIAYFLDPDRGRRRRNMARDRAVATGRRVARHLARRSRAAGAESHGLWQRFVHTLATEEPPPNDVTLARKVESVLFADADIPKGQINVNAERGVVVLRGELDHPEQIEVVLDVRNLLHLRNTAASMHQPSRAMR
jgi:osmotically-inducible protein OsmY